MANETVNVVFRKYKGGDIIALFPNETLFEPGACSSYMHVGQHGAADYSHVISNTVAAAVTEYTPLKAELEGLGYTLNIRRRARVGK